jgi:hypothetical protein
MSVIGWPPLRRDERFTVNEMGMSYLAVLLARGTQATSSAARMSSQGYKPRTLVIRGKGAARSVNGVGRRSSAGAARGRLPGAGTGVTRAAGGRRRAGGCDFVMALPVRTPRPQVPRRDVRDGCGGGGGECQRRFPAPGSRPLTD